MIMVKAWASTTFNCKRILDIFKSIALKTLMGELFLDAQQNLFLEIENEVRYCVLLHKLFICGKEYYQIIYNSSYNLQ